ncbi:MAG: ATP-dependent transcriptional regulator, MalT-like, LuxR family [Actinobacteria bacterium]|nr:ATP-dependent transcriptional regulator, MalT-like, LuxR family [Actinomycetota bacterium]
MQDRRSECEVLDRLLEAVRQGQSRVLVLRGEPGVGKTALLEYVAERASGCRVARAAGVQSEMELAFAGLHQLCAPMLDHLERLPEPQRDALGTAFGLRAGAAPDRFLVGLAVLGLLSEVADERPLVCLIDDVQWLDRASAQALEFVARRLFVESVGLVFAVRQSGAEQPLAGLPELVVEGLQNGDARALLGSAIRWPLDERVRDRIVAETRGNPLALLELPRGLTPAELAGGFGLPGAQALSGRIEESFQRRLAPLPAETRRLLLLAAAEPVGDPTLVWRAAGRLGIGVEAADAAESEGLVDFGARVTFRHPLVRSAIYRAASPQDRRDAHRALADVTDPQVDPDRRAWHLAQATSGPDENVASELEGSAGRAQARGGLAAAAAFLERSAALTLEPGQRAERSLAAARVQAQAGAFDAALRLLATAEAGPLDEFQHARVDLLQGQIAFASGRGSDAPPLLLKAAKRLELLDVGLARETYLEALSAALYASRFVAGGSLREAAEAARAAPAASPPPSAPDLLLDGLALLIMEGYAAAAPTLKQAMKAFSGEGISREEALRWLGLACPTAARLWDDESWDLFSARHVQIAREAGALGVLPIALNQRAGLLLFKGEFAAAASLIEEALAVSEATGSQLPPYASLGLAALRGRERQTSQLIETSAKDLARRGVGVGPAVLQWATALLDNGLGRYEDALAAAQRAGEDSHELVFPTWAAVELIEAATRSGVPERAAGALKRLSDSTRASGSDWALGIEACARALLSDGEIAERLYREALDRLGRTRVRVAIARAHLLYGEWLRRERRRMDARDQLRTAHEMFVAMGAEGFAERARRELLATGETARKRAVHTSSQLTAQEAQVARLARDGLSNPEIGARLFISPRTVQYHLRKVFTKLGVNSRMQLDRVLPSDPNVAWEG